MDSVSPNNLMRYNSGAWHCARAVNPPVHPAVMPGPMPQYYALSNQRRVERVPRPLGFDYPSDTLPAITFSVNGWAGVRVRDILDKVINVDASEDVVFAHYGWRVISMKLEWPGYDRKAYGDPGTSRIDVRPDGEYMTRQHLAREICGLLYDFLKTCSRRPISPEYARWALGGRGINTSDIVLFSLHYYQKSWVPEFYVTG